MEPRSLKFVAEACAGELKNSSPDKIVSRLCTDSRQAQAGDLFFALSGERFDAHRFLPEVACRGVAAIVAEQKKTPLEFAECGVILVENTRKALGQLAARYRSDFDLPVIAVGGSNGKTTTKELIASVLRRKKATLWSEASFNNDIGVPLTLLKLDCVHQAAVLEVGTNHPGELAPLLQIIRPTFGVVTNIGREHLEFFDDAAGVAQEEGAMAETLPAEGTLFLNGDSDWAGSIAQRTRGTIVRVGLSESNDWCAKNVRFDESGVTFWVSCRRADMNGDYRIRLLGRHQVVNALFAVAVGAELGLSRVEIEQGLAECAPPKMRMQPWSANGVRVLDDTYNANADSMLAALQTLRDLPCKGRRIAVLGDMAELGAQSETAHLEVGKYAAELGIDQLFAIGQRAGDIAAAARKNGLKNVIEILEAEVAAHEVEQFVRPGDLVLVKASRSMRLERVTELLRSGAE
jgi:UDP-N-acetylmuramoyl-tripeptide--D-alanyl-D-alanine ligase